MTTSDAIELKQSNVAEEVLRELPGVVPSIGSAVNNGNGGASFVDLRGLGSIRNIVLLDGNRLVPSGLLGRVDLNNIPLALVERVDALTGAAVTTYGADAITGVVNFITRSDFAGIEVAASEQITEQGDGNYIRADLTLGANFDDGRGNAVLSVGYQESDPVYQGARDFSLVQISSYTGGAAGSGTAVPSRFSGTRATSIEPPAPCRPTCQRRATGASARSTGAAIQCRLHRRRRRRHSMRRSTSTRTTSSRRRSRATTSSARPIMKCPTRSRSMPAACSRRTTSRRSSLRRARSAARCTINLNNPFLPATAAQPVLRIRRQSERDRLHAALHQAECDAAARRPARATRLSRHRPSGASCRSTSTATAASTDPITGASAKATTNPDITLNRRTTEVGPRISDFQTTSVRLAHRPARSADQHGRLGRLGRLRRVREQSRKSRTTRCSRASGRVRWSAHGWRQCRSARIRRTAASRSISSVPKARSRRKWPTSSTKSARPAIKTTLGQLRGIISGDVGYALPWATQPIGFARRHRVPQV